MELFQCVEHPAFSCELNNIHYAIHGAEGVAFVYDVLCELRSVVRVYVVLLKCFTVRLNTGVTFRDFAASRCSSANAERGAQRQYYCL
jgi:hypothetical protein